MSQPFSSMRHILISVMEYFWIITGLKKDCRLLFYSISVRIFSHHRAVGSLIRVNVVLLSNYIATSVTVLWNSLVLSLGYVTVLFIILSYPSFFLEIMIIIKIESHQYTVLTNSNSKSIWQHSSNILRFIIKFALQSFH